MPGSGTQSEAGVTNERKGLARRKLLRLLAPQTQESPVFFHLTSSDQLVFDAAIEQMSATGFDMVIFSFGNTHTPTHKRKQVPYGFLISLCIDTVPHQGLGSSWRAPIRSTLPRSRRTLQRHKARESRLARTISLGGRATPTAVSALNCARVRVWVWSLRAASLSQSAQSFAVV